MIRKLPIGFRPTLLRNGQIEKVAARLSLSGCIVLLMVLFLQPVRFVQAQSDDSAGKNGQGLNGGTKTLYEEVYELFESGRVDEAEHQALRLLETRTALSNVDKGLLHEILAFCSIANNDEQNAIRQFVDALMLNPNISPDPLTWSPKMRRAFDKALEEYIQRSERERHFRGALEASVSRKAAMKSLILPGSGQWSKGQKQKGTIMGASFWGSLALFAYSQFLLSAARQDYNDASTSQAAADTWLKYRNARYLTSAAGTLTLSIYLYTFADALWCRPSKDFILPIE